jgi:enediyne biosynthesis protein E4
MRFLFLSVIVLALLAVGLVVFFSDSDSGLIVSPDVAARPASPTEPGIFEDVTAGSGLTFTHRNGAEAGHATILESLGGGVALIDFDGDGLLDIFVTGGGHFDGPDKQTIGGLPCKLYKNLGGFHFKDVTKEVGLDRLADGQPWFWTHGCAVADYDNDSWPDLLVTGWGRLALFHNEPVDPQDPSKGRKFVDVTAAVGLDQGITWATSAAFADLHGDGWPDLYVCQYVNWSWKNNPRCLDLRDQTHKDVCPPELFEALPHRLYRNNAGKSFTEVGAASGLRTPRPDSAYAQLTHLAPAARDRLRRADRAKDYGKGLGVLIADLDDDGLPDIYVANDTSGNLLYLNRGAGRLEEVGTARGVTYDGDGNAPGSMGVDAADYNGTGHLSLFVANFQNQLPGLYRNRGKGQFAFASLAAGLAALGRNYVGFGAGFFDYDLDGNEDLFISHGHVVHHPAPPAEVRQRPVLLRNERRSGDEPFEVRFADVSAKAGPYFQVGHLGRGAALGDLDNDGRVAIVLSPTNEPVVVLRNRAGIGKHWLGVELVGKPYRDAVGARLQLEVAGQTLVRAVKGGGSYLSSGDRRVVFGLGQREQVGRLTVRWPSGATQVWEGLGVDRYWILEEGKKEAGTAAKRRP